MKNKSSYIFIFIISSLWLVSCQQESKVEETPSPAPASHSELKDYIKTPLDKAQSAKEVSEDHVEDVNSALSDSDKGSADSEKESD